MSLATTAAIIASGVATSMESTMVQVTVKRFAFPKRAWLISKVAASFACTKMSQKKLLKLPTIRLAIAPCFVMCFQKKATTYMGRKEAVNSPMKKRNELKISRSCLKSAVSLNK